MLIFEEKIKHFLHNMIESKLYGKIEPVQPIFVTVWKKKLALPILFVA